MTYPNPAGYYNLKLTTKQEAEMRDLPFEGLLELLMELTESIYLGHGFTSTSLSLELDTHLDQLPLGDQISLIRWIGELLAAKHSEA